METRGSRTLPCCGQRAALARIACIGYFGSNHRSTTRSLFLMNNGDDDEKVRPPAWMDLAAGSMDEGKTTGLVGSTHSALCMYSPYTVTP